MVAAYDHYRLDSESGSYKIQSSSLFSVTTAEPDSVITGVENTGHHPRESSVYSPKTGNDTGDNSILWTNIDEKLRQSKDLDEDELLELRHHLEQRKREALIKDILSSSFGISDVDPNQHAVIADNKKPLDVLIENTNARKNFMLMCKQSDKFIECEEHQNSPDFHYFKRCMEANVLPLPTISKINDGVLMLVGYKLNDGVCTALRFGLDKFEGKISKIVLENNGLSDTMLSSLVESFGTQASELTSLSISKNEFGPLTSCKLAELANKAYKLQDL